MPSNETTSPTPVAEIEAAWPSLEQRAFAVKVMRAYLRDMADDGNLTDGQSATLMQAVEMFDQLLPLLAEQEADRRDSERYRFVRPLLGALLQSRHFEDVNDAELYLDFSRGSADGVQLRCGTSGGYVDALVDAAIDAARQSTPTPEATDRAE